jgi:hypothetical protein
MRSQARPGDLRERTFGLRERTFGLRERTFGLRVGLRCAGGPHGVRSANQILRIFRGILAIRPILVCAHYLLAIDRSLDDHYPCLFLLGFSFETPGKPASYRNPAFCRIGGLTANEIDVGLPVVLLDLNLHSG